jgi:hypothetical protein
MSEEDRYIYIRDHHYRGYEYYFWARVDIQADDRQCWTWRNSKYRNGYGSLRIKNPDGTISAKLAHRVAWEITYGPIPEGMKICHKCDNPPCCNPAHLFLGTTQDNNRDMALKGRVKGIHHQITHGSKLTRSIAEEIRKLHREEGLNGPQLSLLFQVSRHHIYSILNGRAWK